MFGWVRNIIIILLVLSLVYAVLSFTSRMKHTARLKSEYKASKNELRSTASQEEYVAKGMKTYHRSYRPKLIFGVYLVPLFVIGLLMYLAQYS